MQINIKFILEQIVPIIDKISDIIFHSRLTFCRLNNIIIYSIY